MPRGKSSFKKFTHHVFLFVYFQSEQDVFVFLFRHGAGEAMQEGALPLFKGLTPAVQAIVRDSKTMIPTAVSTVIYSNIYF